MGAGVCLAASPGTDLAVQGRRPGPPVREPPTLCGFVTPTCGDEVPQSTTVEHQQPSKLRKKVQEEEVGRRRERGKGGPLGKCPASQREEEEERAQAQPQKCLSG